MRLLSSIKYKLRSFASRFVTKATLFEGRLLGSPETLRCLIVGADLGDIRKRTYDKEESVVATKRIWLRDLRRVINDDSDGRDLCVVCLPKANCELQSEDYTYKTSYLIRQRIDIPDCWSRIEKRFRKNLKNVERLVRLHNLSYRISNDIKDFDAFYSEMYRPHIKRQFSELARLDSYEEMKPYFLRGFLLIVRDANSELAAALCLADGDALVHRRTGGLGPNHPSGNAARAALFYYLLQAAQDRGFKQLDCMASLPFLDDLIYKKKREWGAAVFPGEDSDQRIYIRIPEFSKRILRFLELNPMIMESDNGGLYGVVARDNVGPCSAKEREELARKYHAPNLECLWLIDHSGGVTKLQFDDDPSRA
jgi:hypothetical protein